MSIKDNGEIIIQSGQVAIVSSLGNRPNIRSRYVFDDVIVSFWSDSSGIMLMARLDLPSQLEGLFGVLEYLRSISESREYRVDIRGGSFLPRSRGATLKKQLFNALSSDFGFDFNIKLHKVRPVTDCVYSVLLTSGVPFKGSQSPAFFSKNSNKRPKLDADSLEIVSDYFDIFPSLGQ